MTRIACTAGAFVWLFLLATAEGRQAEPPAETGSPARQSAEYILWHLTPSEGANPEITSAVENRIRTFFEKLKGRLIMDGITMDSLLLVEGNEKFLRCGVGPTCVSGLGEIAGIERVIVGEVKKTEGLLTVELVLVDTRKQKIISRASVQSSGPPGVKHMQELSVAMFEPGKYRGSIDLSCAVDGAEVFLDGVKSGVTPLVGPLNTSAGHHQLEVKKLGHQGFSRKIRVPLDDVRRVVALLPAEQSLREVPTRFYQSWVFWTFVGTGLAATVTGVVLHIDAGTLDDNASLAEQRNLTEYQKWQDRADSRHLQSYIAFGVGGAGLLAAGVVAIVDMVSQPEESDNASRVEIGLMPCSSGSGMTATIRF